MSTLPREDRDGWRTCRICGAVVRWLRGDWRHVGGDHDGRVSFACRCGRPWGEAPAGEDDDGLSEPQRYHGSEER